MVKNTHFIKKLFRLILIIVLTAFSVLKTSNAHANKAVFIGDKNSDLYVLLSGNGVELFTFDNVESALPSIKKNMGVFFIATNYPQGRTSITPQLYEVIREKGARLYVEYPSYIPGYNLPEKPYIGLLERGVVSSNFFGKSLPAMSILGINGCHLIPLEVKKPIISYAKVAGFDYAQFGLTDTKAYPLLFIEGNNIFCTTSFSEFTKGRFGPIDHWKHVWEGIIRWTMKNSKFEITHMPADPKPMYTIEEKLPMDARKVAVNKGTQWLWKAKLFIHPSWEATISDYQPEGGDPNLFFGPPISDDMLQGDGSRGIMEGHGSHIYHDGSQMYRYFTRADVQGETAYLLAASSKLNQNSHYKDASEKLLDYLFYTSDFRGKERNNKKNPAYGLIGWANTHLGVFFNDDNARCILGAIGASAYLENERWNQFIVENILGNLRTSSKQGFQGGALNQIDIETNGWQYYNSRDFINLHPHFESWMLACYLWLYDKTGYEPLLSKAKSAISILMDGYPDKWHSQNGIQQERARMILPLSWLVRVEDTDQHRKWLDMIVSKVLESQDESGAIREELGSSESDKNKILVTSNEAYGKNEAPLIAKNGNPVADMLYTCNFTFFGLNEAVHATKNSEYKAALDKLSDFLVRVQVKSDNHPDIDGAWFRAFDYGRWDYWASNADNGWGAWCTLTGWIQAWITSTQVLIEEKESFWNKTKKMNMSEALSNSIWMMKE